MKLSAVVELAKPLQNINRLDVIAPTSMQLGLALNAASPLWHQFDETMKRVSGKYCTVPGSIYGTVDFVKEGEDGKPALDENGNKIPDHESFAAFQAEVQALRDMEVDFNPPKIKLADLVDRNGNAVECKGEDLAALVGIVVEKPA